MNLHGIASAAIGAVNPSRTVNVQFSQGYTAGAGAKRTPAYSVPVKMRAQIQPVSTKDLQQLDGLNLTGVQKTFYLFGEIDAIVRVKQKGGDLITTENNEVWLTVQVTEQWHGWCAVVATLQNGS